MTALICTRSIDIDAVHVSGGGRCMQPDLPTYDHSFAGQEVQFSRILLHLAGHPSPTPPTYERK